MLNVHFADDYDLHQRLYQSVIKGTMHYLAIFAKETGVVVGKEKTGPYY